MPQSHSPDDADAATPCDETAWLRWFRAAVESAYNGILVTDTELDEPGPRILYVNPAYCRMTGYRADEVVGRNPRFMQGPDTDREVLRRLRRNCERGEFFEGQAINYRKDGTPFHMQWTIAPVRDATGRIVQFVAIQRDVTAEVELREELERQASHDPLTGLFNRQHTQQLLDREIERAARYGNGLSLVMLDIDAFKQVNDTHGHSAGDEAIRHVGRVLETRLRAADMAGRWGGEEFLALLPCTDAAGALRAAQDLRARVESTSVNAELTVTVSAGVATHAPGDDASTLFNRADAALYAAKAAGRNRVVEASGD